MSKGVKAIFDDGRIEVSWDRIEQAVKYEILLADDVVSKGEKFCCTVTAFDSNNRNIGQYDHGNITGGVQSPTAVKSVDLSKTSHAAVAGDLASVVEESGTQKQTGLQETLVYNIFRKVFPGMSESDMGKLVEKSQKIGIQLANDLQYLMDPDVANELRGTLKIVELKKLLDYVKEGKYKIWADGEIAEENCGQERPLPPSNLRLPASEYPNTAITVFFDDLNKMMCDYIVTALDMDSDEKISVESSSNFGVLKDLKPGRQYVIYAQCVTNDVRSKKTFFGDVIRVFGYGAEEADTSSGVTIHRGVQSAPTIDSAYHSEQPDDMASVVTKPDIKLGEDAAASVVGECGMRTETEMQDGKSPPVTRDDTISSAKVHDDGKTSVYVNIKCNITPRSETQYQDGQNLAATSLKEKKKISAIDNKELLDEGAKKIRDHVFYYPKKRLRKRSEVFEGYRRDAAGKEEMVVKILKFWTEESHREIVGLKYCSDHPNVITYYESGFFEYEHEEAAFIAMKKLDKETLADKLSSNLGHPFQISKICIDKKLSQLKDLARGLLHIHTQQIMHRDLKPGNILFENGKLVVSDFGLCRHCPADRSITPTERVGSEGWRSPEVERWQRSKSTSSSTSGLEDRPTEYREKMTAKSDVFPAGLIFYSILTDGIHPFDDPEQPNDPTIRSYNIKCNTDSPNISHILDPCVMDGQIAHDLISKMLRKERDKRPGMIDVLRHPTFWIEIRKLEFFVDVVKYMESANPDGKSWRNCSDVLNLDEDVQERGIALPWNEPLKNKETLKDSDEQPAKNTGHSKSGEITTEKTPSVEKKSARELLLKKIDKSFDVNKVTHLVRFIRNRYIHNHESGDDVPFRKDPISLYRFFSNTFPGLFIHVYRKCESHYKDGKWQGGDDLPAAATYF